MPIFELPLQTGTAYRGWIEDPPLRFSHRIEKRIDSRWIEMARSDAKDFMPNVPFSWGPRSSTAGSLKASLVLLAHIHDDLVFHLHVKFAREIVRGFTAEWQVSALTLTRWVLKRCVEEFASTPHRLAVEHWWGMSN